MNTSQLSLSTLGLLGGMSWESSLMYYQQINRYVNKHAGGLHSAPLLLDSVNFAPIAHRMHAGDWVGICAHLQRRAQALETAGARCIALATNTMHKLFDDIASSVQVPMIHIATPTIAALHEARVSTVAFLGTRFSMEEDFLRNIYRAEGITLHIPDRDDRESIHSIIMNELCLGVVNDRSRLHYQEVVQRLALRGTQGVIFGCTEIGMLLRQQDLDMPIFDSTLLHTRALGKFVLSGSTS